MSKSGINSEQKDKLTSRVQFALAIASLSRIMLSNWRTVIRYEFFPTPVASLCLSILYFSTNKSAASGVNYPLISMNIDK
jgi:hypothetical protein